MSLVIVGYNRSMEWKCRRRVAAAAAVFFNFCFVSVCVIALWW